MIATGLSCPHHPNAGYQLADKWGRCICPKCGEHVGWVKPPNLFLIERPACPDCGQTGSVHLMRTVQVNGNSLVYWHCEPCEKHASNPLPHRSVLDYLEYLRQRLPDRTDIPATIEGIRTKYDYRESETCFACGSTQGTEFHHFMPKAFKDDSRVAPNWQRWNHCGVRLCRQCHELWHELIAPMDLLAGVNGNGEHHVR